VDSVTGGGGKRKGLTQRRRENGELLSVSSASLRETILFQYPATHNYQRLDGEKSSSSPVIMRR
jgi:hypothetical protein